MTTVSELFETDTTPIVVLKVFTSAEDPSKMKVIECLNRSRICVDMDNPYIQEVWDVEQERQSAAGSNNTAIKNYIMFSCNKERDDWDFMVVYFPESHCEYSFRDADGIAQWYFQPRTGFNPKNDLPAGFDIIRHKFFQTSLVPVRQSLFDSLSALLKFVTVALSWPDERKGGADIRYNLEIRLNGNYLIEKPARIDPDAHTKHYIRGGTNLRHISNILCGPSSSRPTTKIALRLMSTVRTINKNTPGMPRIIIIGDDDEEEQPRPGPTHTEGTPAPTLTLTPAPIR